MSYDDFVDACNTGSACPACFTTVTPFIKKVADMSLPPFRCLMCGHRFRGHEFVDHAIQEAA
ncbi:MAG TPA: hypothetical protein VGE96_00940 [Steroidobacteraceae bacterium]